MKKSLRKSLNYVTYTGVAQYAMDTFATGTIITAYALLLGAGNIAIGILGAVPYIGNLIHIFAAWLLERGFSVKKVSVTASFLARPFYLFAAFLVFFPKSNWTIAALICFLILAYAIGNVAGGAWRPWMKCLIPDQIMGRFFANRFRWMTVARMICFSLASGIIWYFNTYWPNDRIYAYALLLAVAYLIGLYGAWGLTQVDDVSLQVRKEESFWHKVCFCLKHKAFIQMMKVLGYVTFSVNFITPFLTVYMIKRLRLGEENVVILSMFSMLVYTLVVKKMGRYADRYGIKDILLIAIAFFILTLIGFALLNTASLSTEVLFACLLIIHIFWGVNLAGIALGTNNLSLQYVPKEKSAIYLSVNGTVLAAFGAVGSVLGGFAMSGCAFLFDRLALPALSWFMLFGISIVLFIFSAVQFRKLKKIQS